MFADPEPRLRGKSLADIFIPPDRVPIKPAADDLTKRLGITHSFDIGLAEFVSEPKHCTLCATYVLKGVKCGNLNCDAFIHNSCLANAREMPCYGARKPESAKEIKEQLSIETHQFTEKEIEPNTKLCNFCGAQISDGFGSSGYVCENEGCGVALHKLCKRKLLLHPIQRYCTGRRVLLPLVRTKRSHSKRKRRKDSTPNMLDVIKLTKKKKKPTIENVIDKYSTTPDLISGMKLELKNLKPKPKHSKVKQKKTKAEENVSQPKTPLIHSARPRIRHATPDPIRRPSPLDRRYRDFTLTRKISLGTIEGRGPGCLTLRTSLSTLGSKEISEEEKNSLLNSKAVDELFAEAKKELDTKLAKRPKSMEIIQSWDYTPFYKQTENPLSISSHELLPIADLETSDEEPDAVSVELISSKLITSSKIQNPHGTDLVCPKGKSCTQFDTEHLKTYDHPWNLVNALPIPQNLPDWREGFVISKKKTEITPIIEIIFYGSKFALLSRLADLNSQHKEFIEEFLYSYRTVLTPLELFNFLEDRYQNLPKNLPENRIKLWKSKQSSIKTGVLNIFKRWLSEHHYDFEAESTSGEELYAKTLDFIDRCSKVENNEILGELKGIIQQKHSTMLNLNSMKKIPLHLIIETFRRKFPDCDFKRSSGNDYNCFSGQDFIDLISTVTKLTAKEIIVIGNDLLYKKMIIQMTKKQLRGTSIQFKPKRYYRLALGSEAKDPPAPKIRNLTDIHISQLKLRDIQTLELARQLTVKSNKLFRKIPILEFIDKKFHVENLEKKAPHLFEYFEWMSKLSSWIKTEIVSIPNVKQRATVISKFIELGIKCKDLHNYSDMTSIAVSLSNSCISRLSNTWSIVLKNSQIKKFWKELSRLLDPSGGNQNLREEMEKCTGPMVPYLSKSVKELVLLDESGLENLTKFEDIEKILTPKENLIENAKVHVGPFSENFFVPSMMEPDGVPVLINWHKRRIQAKILKQIEMARKDELLLQPVPYYQLWLASQLLVLYDEKQLYAQSLVCEPRVNTT